MPGNAFPSPEGGRKTSVVGFTVRQLGQVQMIPTRFFVRKREIVLWIIGNDSGQQIDVSLENFVRGGAPVNPVFDWVLGTQANGVKVNIGIGQIGLIAGVLSDKYDRQAWFWSDRVNYTIRVHATNGAFPDQVYDPDGEIKP